MGILTSLNLFIAQYPHKTHKIKIGFMYMSSFFKAVWDFVMISINEATWILAFKLEYWTRIFWNPLILMPITSLHILPLLNLTWMMVIWSEVLMLDQQPCYSLSHLLSSVWLLHINQVISTILDLETRIPYMLSKVLPLNDNTNLQQSLYFLEDYKRKKKQNFKINQP